MGVVLPTYQPVHGGGELLSIAKVVGLQSRCDLEPVLLVWMPIICCRSPR